MTVATDQEDAVLYSYRVASADMKYIEINTREICLRHEADQGLVLRGEIPGCGISCQANLSEVFLEFAMSCKGCEDSSVMMESVANFGERLGEIVSQAFLTRFPEKTPQELVPLLFDCVLESMGVPYRKETSQDSLDFTLLESPLGIKAGRSGLKLWISPAYHGFVTFFESILSTAGGGWELVAPKSSGSDHSLTAIRLQRAAP